MISAIRDHEEVDDEGAPEPLTEVKYRPAVSSG